MNNTVLVIDEDTDCRSALGELLEAEGYKPALYGHCREAVFAIAEQPPSVVIMDLPLPNTASAELFTVLRGHDLWRSIPVVVFTAWALRTVPCRREISVVQKPDVSALLAALDSVCPRTMDPRDLQARDGDQSRRC